MKYPQVKKTQIKVSIIAEQFTLEFALFFYCYLAVFYVKEV